jgi:hypothetical protein
MWRWSHARVDNRVDTLNDKLSAAKAQQFANIEILSDNIMRQKRYDAEEILSQHVDREWFRSRQESLLIEMYMPGPGI